MKEVNQIMLLEISEKMKPPDLRPVMSKLVALRCLWEKINRTYGFSVFVMTAVIFSEVTFHLYENISLQFNDIYSFYLVGGVIETSSWIVLLRECQQVDGEVKYKLHGPRVALKLRNQRGKIRSYFIVPENQTTFGTNPASKSGTCK